MYDLPELQGATDAWWLGLAEAMQSVGVESVSTKLSRSEDDAAFWRRKDLLFSQTCGYPLMTAFRDDLQLLGTPHYDVPGCTEMSYGSWIIVPEDHPAQSPAGVRGGVCAVNGFNSQSGMNTLRHAIAPLANGEAFFREVVVSGRHRLSVQMVANGQADVAAIDCVTWALIEKVAPQELAGVRIMGETAKVPGLPYVTAADRDDKTVEALRASVRLALKDPGLATTRQALGICGFSETTLADYDVILEMEREAADQGYPVLR
jgi:ABC-type phosphate/phosphonate transport system substrate-binding protein